MGLSTILSIDPGSSYTKVAIRRGWNQDSDLIRDLSLEEERVYCFPSIVAKVETRGRVEWLTGEAAFGRPRGGDENIYENWKKHVFPVDRDRADGEYLEVALNYFRGLKTLLGKLDERVINAPCRIAIPSLPHAAEQAAELVAIARTAGFKMLSTRPWIFEPEANAVGVFTRARNASRVFDGSPTRYPIYLDMFEKQGPLAFAREKSLQKAGSEPGRDAFRLLVVDVGAFTTDVGCVEYRMPELDIEQFQRPKVNQLSWALGIEEVDKAICRRLARKKRTHIESMPASDWEGLKRRLYHALETELVTEEGSLIIGGHADYAIVEEEMTEFAKRVVEAVAEFCDGSEVRPFQALITGGGLAIPSLRAQLAKGIRAKFDVEAANLLDPDEPRKALLPKPLWDSEWNPDETEARARVQLNHELARGGSALGACSVFNDLPAN